MSAAGKVQGTVIVKICNAGEEKDFLVPDPEELSREIPLSPSKKYMLRVLRESIGPSSTPPRESQASVGLSVPVLEDSKYSLPSTFCPDAVIELLDSVSTAITIGTAGQQRMYRYHQRNQAMKRSPAKLRKKKLERALRAGNPFARGTWKCCKRYQCFQRIGPARCFQEYREINRMNPKQAKRHLISLYDQADNVFRVGGIVVCARFLAKAFGFSNDRQCSVKNTPRAKGSAIALSKPREVKRNTKRAFIALFINRLAKLFGDAMPHKEQITLPVLTRKALWEECKKAWIEKYGNYGDMELSQNYFYRVWRAYASLVTIRKNHGFTQCSRCVMLSDAMAKRLRDEETLITLIDQHATHLRFIERERMSYEARQALAEQYPKRYCSIIVDGADQKNYGLPHFSRNTKSDAGHKMKVKVIGVLEHVMRGQEQLSLFTMTEEYPTGANHIIEIIHRTLQRKKNKFGRLPPTLFVQVDNCIRENKNRYFMGYLQSFVHLGVFKTVQVSFLPIGHTHADIDQTFSSISTHLKLNDAITLRELLSELEKCYAQRVVASELETVTNYSDLCEQSGCLNDVECFSEYRYFRFVQRGFGAVHGLHDSACDVKVRDEDSWTPFPTSSAEGFLKFVPNLSQTPPIKTKLLPNRAEISKCIDAAEERIRDFQKVEVLRKMRDKIFQQREESFRWEEAVCFEMNGDYINDYPEDQNWTRNSATTQAEEAIRPNYGYDPDDFVAAKSDGDENTKFWIGRVKGVAEVDATNRTKKITLRWYVASGKDPWEAKYNPAWKSVGGEQTVYEDDIVVESVLVRFGRLTTSNRLYARDKKAIRQTLNEN